MNEIDKLILESLKRNLKIKPRKVLQIIPLKYHASNRRYFRIKIKGRDPIIAMKIMKDPTVAEEITDKNLTISELPFIDVQREFSKIGMPVPEIYHYDESNRLMFLEDLGEITLEDYMMREDTPDFYDYYKEGIRIIAAIQRNADKISENSVIKQRRFTHDILLNEFYHFLEYGITARFEVEIENSDKQAFNDFFERIITEILKMSYTVVHRDFQSRNLMVSRGSLKVIDFQDALLGPYTYDLVAFLRDSYVVLNRNSVLKLIEYYCELMNRDVKQTLIDFYTVTMQRKLKDAGRFIYIDKVKGNPDFLKFYKPSLNYVLEACEVLPQYRGLSNLISKYIKF